MIDTNNMIGAAVGNEQVVALAVGKDVVWTSNTPPTPTPLPSGYTQVVNGIRSSNAPSWDEYQYIDTGKYVTGNPEIRVKYIGCGTFSDRIVGFDSLECSSDDEDLRWFPDMCDIAEVRLSIPASYYSNGVQQDISFGNAYAFDNLNNQTIASDTPSGTIDPNATIRIDMSCNWIQEVVISMDGVVVWNGIAATDGNDYGMYDTISQSFVTSNNCVVIPNV